MTISSLQWRYATKAFDPNRKIPADQWADIEQSLVLTPSSFGLQPWKFIVVETADIRESLVDHSWGQRQVADASHFLVLAHKKSVDEAFVDSWVDVLARVQNRPAAELEGYKGMIMGFTANMSTEQMLAWSQRQTYIVLGQLMAFAADLEIDACPMEGIDPVKYDEILGLAGTGYTTSVACALGYRSDADKYASIPKARFPAEAVIERR